MTPNIINWDRAMLERFKIAWIKARAAKLDSFKFDGNEFVTSYATYLIEYLEGVLPK